MDTNSSALIEVFHAKTDFPAGDFDHREWDEAQPVAINRYWSGDVAPAARHAEARLLWSDKALHLRFVCHQAEPLVISSTPQFEKKSMNLWDRDVCEIFIAPDEQAIERYLELEAAPTGEWLDVAVHWTPEKRESDWGFQSNMSAAGRVEEDRVTIGMRIPWNDWMREPQEGERWRVNLFRCVGSGKNRGYLTWQPSRTPQANFHVPQVFGSLVFK